MLMNSWLVSSFKRVETSCSPSLLLFCGTELAAIPAQTASKLPGLRRANSNYSSLRSSHPMRRSWFDQFIVSLNSPRGGVVTWSPISHGFMRSIPLRWSYVLRSGWLDILESLLGGIWLPRSFAWAQKKRRVRLPSSAWSLWPNLEMCIIFV